MDKAKGSSVTSGSDNGSTGKGGGRNGAPTRPAPVRALDSVNALFRYFTSDDTTLPPTEFQALVTIRNRIAADAVKAEAK